MSKHFRSIAALRQSRKWHRILRAAKHHLTGAHRGQSFVEMVFTVMGVAVVIITAIEGSIVLNRGMAVKQLAYQGARYAAANPGFTSSAVLAFVSQIRAVGTHPRYHQVSMSPSTTPRVHGAPVSVSVSFHRSHHGRAIRDLFSRDRWRDNHRDESVAKRDNRKEDFNYELDSASRHDGSHCGVC